MKLILPWVYRVACIHSRDGAVLSSKYATGRGFICVIYPKGLEDSQIPCIDFRQRGSK